MNTVRIIFLGGRASFRALFNWRHPSAYIPTMLGLPVLQLLFFALLGRAAGVADDRFFVVGIAVQSTAVAGIFGMVMALTNERMMGTLSSVLGTPANRLALYYGRTLPVIANGLVGATFTLAVGGFLLHIRVPVAALPAIAGTFVVTAVSSAMFGLALGAVSMRTRDLWVGSNLVFNLMLLLCGTAVPLAALPGWLAAVGRALPVTGGIEATRRLVGGAGLPDVAGLIGREALNGVLYGALGYVLLRIFEMESRRRGSLDSTI